MSRHPTRRRVIQAGTALGACAGLGVLSPVMAQSIHTPEASLDRWHRGICGLCGAGDPLFLGVERGQLKTVKGDALSPVGYGRLCTRGMTFPAGLPVDRRLSTPLLRRDAATKGSDGGLEAVSWEDALAAIGEHLSPLFGGGSRRVGVLLDGGLPCESLHAWRRLFGELLGCETVDCGARLGGLGGLDAAIGATGLPAPTGTTEDLERADVVLIAGVDLAARHATLMSRVAQCKRRGTTRVVLIDPRRSGTCSVADVHVRPQVPGSEASILVALQRALLAEGVVAADAAEGLPALDLAVAADRSGARREDLEVAAAALADAGSVVSLVGRDPILARSVFDLHVRAGWLRDGSTVIPLLENANDAGAALLGVRCDAAPATAWVDLLRSGEMQAVLWIGGNPLPRLPAQGAWRDALSKRFLVQATPVSPLESTAWADVVLPMSLPWAEERGCFVNHERRVQLSAPAGPPPEVPTSLELAVRLSSSLVPADAHTAQMAPYAEYGPELAWEQIRSASAGTHWDAGGMTYERLSVPGGLLWPHPVGVEPGTVHDPSSARIEPIHERTAPSPAPPAEPVADSSMLHLVTFDCAHHHGAREVTGFVPELHYASPRAWIEISGRDASKRKLEDGAWTTMESAVGVIVARLWITDRVPRGVVAIPHGFGFCGDLEGGTDGRAEPESIPGLLTASPEERTMVTLRTPTDEEMTRRALRKS